MVSFDLLTKRLPDSSSRYRHHPHAVFTELDGEITLFQSNTCDYLVLNETGSAIWELLKDKPTALEICQSLQSEFEVSASECELSVNEWLKYALEKKVIELA